MTELKGIAGAPGLVMYQAVVYQKSTGENVTVSLNEARQICLKKVDKLYDKTLKELGQQQADIFSAYKMLLEDEMLFMPVQEAINAGADPVQAVLDTTSQMSSIIGSKGGEYMRQRAEDIKYIGQMVIAAMRGEQSEFEFPDGEEAFILAAEELTPVDTMQFDPKKLGGLMTELGGATSHTVLLAKSLGIPAVVGLKNLTGSLKSGDRVILNGYTGEVIVNPDQQALEYNSKRLEEEKQLQAEFERLKDSETKTRDGIRINLYGNIGKPLDLKAAENMRFDGIGLFRTEFLYSAESEAPSVDQQLSAYQKVIDQIAPNTVTIRTLDAGGDKELPYLNMPKEENPFLGNRGIRLCLRNKELFTQQLKAILRAAANHEIKLMLPMVTSVQEIEKTRDLLNEIKQDLKSQNVPCCEHVKLGVMIETPASAIMAEHLAKHCDFFSIGTNDLTQYIMSADRGNAQVQEEYNPSHPAVIRMLAHVIQTGEKAGIEVSVCGDLAADLKFTKLLLGMGLKSFSVPLPMLGRMKYKIGSIDSADAKRLAETIVSMEDERKISQILEEVD